MLASYGWKSRVSERRGFTAVKANQESRPPVVVALHDSGRGMQLFRSALDEAMSRSIRLVVLDCGAVSLHDQLWGSDFDSQEHQDLKSLWTNPHVSVIRAEDFESATEATVAYCRSNEVTLLVVAADLLADAAMDKTSSARLLRGKFDLLVVTDH